MKDEVKTLAISSHYAGEAGEKYKNSRLYDPYLLKFQLDFRYFEPYLKATDILLDFGCGNGGLLNVLRQHVAQADGLEVNPAVLQQARSFANHIYTSLDALPKVPTYDVVVSNHVLEHIRDVPTTLSIVRQTMNSGGRLLLKLPIDDWRAAHQKKWSKDDIDHHLYTWTPRLIANLLYETGYEVADIQIITFAWHPKLSPLFKFGLGELACKALSMYRQRRQLFVVGIA